MRTPFLLHQAVGTPWAVGQCMTGRGGAARCMSPAPPFVAGPGCVFTLCVCPALAVAVLRVLYAALCSGGHVRTPPHGRGRLPRPLSRSMAPRALQSPSPAARPWVLSLAETGFPCVDKTTARHQHQTPNPITASEYLRHGFHEILIRARDEPHVHRRAVPGKWHPDSPGRLVRRPPWRMPECMTCLCM